jgi:phage recombination protein Bet
MNRPATTNGAGMALNAYSPEKLAVIKNTVAKGATNDELEMFLTLAGRYNLDPFLKEIWFIKRAKKQKKWNNNGREYWDYPRLQNGEIDYTNAETVIMTSRDGYLKAARQERDFIGLRASEIKEGDNFSYDPVTQEIQHKITGKRGAVTGAWAIAKAEGREDVVIYVDFDEYKAGTGNAVFDKYPSAMIKKIAEVLALKRQFGLNGLLTKEEMSADYDVSAAEKGPELIDYKPEPEKQPDTQAQNKEQPSGSAGQNRTSADEIKKKDWLKLAERVRDLRDELGITQEQLIEAVERTLGLSTNPVDWDLKQLRQVKNFLQDELKRIDPLPPKPADPATEEILRSFEESEKRSENK